METICSLVGISFLNDGHRVWRTRRQKSVDTDNQLKSRTNLGNSREKSPRHRHKICQGPRTRTRTYTCQVLNWKYTQTRTSFWARVFIQLWSHSLKSRHRCQSFSTRIIFFSRLWWTKGAISGMPGRCLVVPHATFLQNHWLLRSWGGFSY